MGYYEKGQVMAILEGHSSVINRIAISPSGSKLASASIDGTVQVWDIAADRSEWTLKGHSDSVYSIGFAPDGSMVASGSKDSTVRVWDVATGHIHQTLRRHLGPVISKVVFSSDGCKLA